MVEYSRFFGAEGEPEYSQPQFAEVLSKIFSNGVFTDVLNELEVVEHDPAAMAVDIKSGEGWINGYWYQNTADLTKTLAAADPDNDRIDRVVLRLDVTDELKISVEVLTGTPAADPDPPELTQDSDTYEISLAQVLVGDGVTSVTDANITDEREFAEVNHAPVSDDDLTEQSLVVTTIASSATPTPARASKKTELEITALAAAAEFAAPSGTPVNGDLLFISITDNGTTRALTYNAIYDDPYSAELPTDTTANLTILMLFRYSSARSKWELLFTDEGAA